MEFGSKKRFTQNLNRNEAFFQQNNDIPTGRNINQVRKNARSSGTLLLREANLNQLPNEIFALDEGLDENEKWWQCEPVVRVDISMNSIEFIPNEICNLVDLKMLQIRNNKINYLPKELFTSCNNIQNIDGSNNMIQELDNSIGALHDLREIKLNNNKLRQIPTGIDDCYRLQHIELQENMIESLSDNFGNIKNLVHCNLSKNRLSTLPVLINLKSLKLLDVSNNQLSELNDLSALQSLTYLDASHNRLSYLERMPESLVRIHAEDNKLRQLKLNCPNLVELLIGNNSLDVLNDDLKSSINIRLLDLSNNSIRDLPPWLGSMRNLDRIVCHGNPIRSIKQSYLNDRSCENLKRFLRSRDSSTETEQEISGGKIQGNSPFIYGFRNVDGNKLTLSKLSLQQIDYVNFNECVNSMSNVVEIINRVDLSSNMLSSFPLILQSLYNLTELNLSSNKLGTASLSDLSFHCDLKLRSLDLSSNLMKSSQCASFIHPFLDSLEHLILKGNKLEDLNFNLPCTLREIDVSHNCITSLAFSRLEALETFNLESNKVRDISNLWNLSPMLSTLLIDNNEVVELHPSLAMLPIKKLSCYGNPLRNIRQSIIGDVNALMLLLQKRLGPQ